MSVPADTDTRSSSSGASPSPTDRVYRTEAPLDAHLYELLLPLLTTETAGAAGHFQGNNFFKPLELLKDTYIYVISGAV